MVKYRRAHATFARDRWLDEDFYTCCDRPAPTAGTGKEVPTSCLYILSSATAIYVCMKVINGIDRDDRVTIYSMSLLLTARVTRSFSYELM